MTPLHYIQKGPPLKKHAIILMHGLLGSLENLNVIANSLSKYSTVISVDCRNHGKSPHCDSMSYIDMSNDIEQLTHDMGLSSCDIIGHSMGGKIAMCIALRQQINLKRQVIIDIAPKSYPSFHHNIMDTLLNIDLQNYISRTQVSAACATRIPNQALRQFLMKSIDASTQPLRWKINLDSIKKHLSIISEFPKELLSKSVSVPSLFIYGTRSDYVTKNDFLSIFDLFPETQFKAIDASHWVHAEKPIETTTCINQFLY